MRKHILTRMFNKFSDSETKKAQESFDSVKSISCLDPDVFSYPCTQILVAESDKPIMFLPVQTCFVLEALGPTVEATDMEIASALKQLTATIHWEAGKAGMGEALFFCKHEMTQKFAESHGWEKIDMPVYRWKVNR